MGGDVRVLGAGGVEGENGVELPGYIFVLLYFR